MKTLLIILMLLIAAPAMSQKVGYLIVIDNGKKLEVIKTTELVEVYAAAEIVSPGNCINFENELNKSPFIEIRSGNKSVYIEKKKVGKNGKLKRIKK